MSFRLVAAGFLCAAILGSCDISKKYEREEEILIQNYLQSVGDTVYTRTPSGLYYYIISEGSGTNPVNGDTVSIWYKAKFLSGQLFDSNFEQTDPYFFIIGSNTVIKGIDEGVRLIKNGGKIKLITPSSLAYGASGLYGYNAYGYYQVIVPGYTPFVWEIEIDNIWTGSR